MYQVDVHISASPSNYWAELSFTDVKGTAHVKTLFGEREATVNSNMLQGFIQAVEILQRPCILNIYTESDYLISAFRNAWIQEWKKSGWMTAKKKEVRNREQWQQLDKMLARHSVKFIKMEI